ncbi:MAG: cell wall hydrolase [Gammaproteobacteria bacterium]|nr:cell wall hydrolase [Gammaproteobacteria bacterium]MDH5799876.1 cell wall hydrolase [Gammaproteobacteria bacterium]
MLSIIFKPFSLFFGAITSIYERIYCSYTMVNLRYWWQGFGTTNQVLLIAGGLFLSTTGFTTYMVLKDQYEMRDIRCLAMNVYHEARGEPKPGKYAVAKVTMNRVDSKHHPNDVCRVVYYKQWSKRRQRYISAFSWTNDKVTDIPEESQAWIEAVRIAREVYREEVPANKVKDALFYHADYVKPRWARNKVKVAKIGKHIFYK